MRYYLHLDQNSKILEDPEGIDLPDRAALDVHTLKIARDLLAEDAIVGVVDLATTLCVCDERGTQVLRLAYADAVTFLPIAR